MAKLAITIPEIVNAVKQQNTVNPAGQIGGEPVPAGQEFTYAVRSQGRLEKEREFGNIAIRANSDGSLVRLKDVGRIQSLLCVYFLVLLVKSLLERELRQAMQREGVESLPMYPEERACRRPTARRLIDVFDDVQRHTLTGGDEPVVLVSELSGLQRRLLKLLGAPVSDYRG